MAEGARTALSGEAERYRPLSDVRFRVIGGEAVVLKQEAAEVLVLNEVGARILELLDGEHTTTEVLETLGREFDAEAAVLAGDLESFLRDLTDSGVVERIPI